MAVAVASDPAKVVLKAVVAAEAALEVVAVASVEVEASEAVAVAKE